MRRDAAGYVAVGRDADAAAPAEDSRAAERSVPGCFSLLYESDDGRLCLFEDRAGHLSAVDARRFA